MKFANIQHRGHNSGVATMQMVGIWLPVAGHLGLLASGIRETRCITNMAPLYCLPRC